MAKLAPIFRVGPTSDAGIVTLKFPFSYTVNGALKALPGCRWSPEHHSWVGPAECEKEYLEISRRHGWEFYGYTDAKPNLMPVVNPQLYPYQVQGVYKALHDTRVMLNFEMGLGKTAAAIEACRLGAGLKILVVCPAIVRRVWRDEFTKWWPGHPEVALLEKGTDAPGEWITVVSYELLKKLVDQPRTYSAIVLDECHYVKTRDAQRSAAVADLLVAHKGLVLALTGTPITNEPKDLFNQLSILWPKRFGTWFKFTERYCGKVENAYADSGYTIKGLNAEHAAELERRLRAVSVRATKKEVAHLLPPLSIQSIRVAPKRCFNPRELIEAFTRVDAHRTRLMDVLSRFSSEKIDFAVEWALGALQEKSHVAILTHLRSTAYEIAQRLKEKNVAAEAITGDISPATRIDILTALARQPSGTLVATMHSIGTGIDLTHYTAVLCAELYASPGVLAQVFARFHRLSGKAPVNINLLVLEGSPEERIAFALERKITDTNAVIAAGVVDSKMEAALSPENLSDEDIMAALRKMADEKVEEDEYAG